MILGLRIDIYPAKKIFDKYQRSKRATPRVPSLSSLEPSRPSALYAPLVSVRASDLDRGIQTTGLLLGVSSACHFYDASPLLRRLLISAYLQRKGFPQTINRMATLARHAVDRKSSSLQNLITPFGRGMASRSLVRCE